MVPHPAPAPTFESSEPLSLTESHLSIEATNYSQLPPLASAVPSSPFPPSAVAPASRASSATLNEGGIEAAQRPASECLKHGGNLSEDEKMDLEKGPRGSGEYEEPSLLAADGRAVLIVDWKGEDDPAFPKNWSNRRRMGATLMWVNPKSTKTGVAD